MRKTLIIIGIALALFFSGAIYLLVACPTSVTVRNDSRQSLAGVSVTVQGRRLDFPDLAAGLSARRWFHNKGPDGHFSLLARRSDGTQISAEEGYITSGDFYGSAHFTITSDGDVTFAQDY